MKLEIFIYFNGNCREAVDFYAKVFGAETGNIMTYGEMPPDPEYPVREADIDRIAYAGLPVGGMVLMFADVPYGARFVCGSNVNPTVNSADKDEVARICSMLSDGGEIMIELAPTFFSELYCMVKDRFGVIWQIMHYEPQK